MQQVTHQQLHIFSQLVYLDAVPAMEEEGVTTVESLCRYYRENPVGSLYLRSRFGGIQREYEGWKSFLEQGAAPCRGWRIADILDDNGPRQSGFYGCSYLGPEGQRVVAFRGSELLGNRRYKNDYVTDLGLAYLETTPQQEVVNRYWRTIAGCDVSRGLWITGHSLGGNLALYGAICAPGWVRGALQLCASFNGPGFNNEFMDKNENGIAAVADRLLLYQNRYDLVSSLLNNVAEPALVASLLEPDKLENPSVDDILYPHSNFMFVTGSDGELIPDSRERKSTFCNLVHTLSEMVMRLPVLVRRGLSDAILAALYAAPTPENAARYGAEAVMKYISHNAVFQAPEHREDTALAYSAGLLAHREDSAQIYQEALEEAAESQGAALAKAMTLLLRMLAPHQPRESNLLEPQPAVQSV